MKIPSVYRSHPGHDTDEPREGLAPYGFGWKRPEDGNGYCLATGRTTVDQAEEFDPNDDGPSIRLLKKEIIRAIVRRSDLLADQRDRDAAMSRFVSSKPLEDCPALFREFASLDPLDDEQILAFANRYGSLGRSIPIYFDPPQAEAIERFPESLREDLTMYLAGEGPWPKLNFDSRRLWMNGRFKTNVAESVDFWRECISDMKLSVSISDLLVKSDQAGLDRYVTFKQADIVPLSDQRPRWNCFVTDPSDDSLSIFVRDTTENPCPELSYRSAFDFVLLSVERALRRRVQPHFDIGRGAEQLGLKLFPDDLLTAMWLQFGQAIAGNKQYRVCKACSAWFEISGEDDARTAKRLFCSDSCKSRDYRRRRAEKGKGRA